MDLEAIDFDVVAEGEQSTVGVEDVDQLSDDDEDCDGSELGSDGLPDELVAMADDEDDLVADPDYVPRSAAATAADTDLDDV